MKRSYLWLLGLTPLIFACSNNKASTPINNLKTINSINSNEDVEEEACTVMYVGKALSRNGKAFIARSSDAGPGAMCINTTIFKHNQLANKTITSNKGFSYKMPSTTYRYISTPRNPVIHKGNHWEASAVNENGVGVSATLSCYYNEDVKKVDPLVEGGLSEDNIAQIVGATAKTAKEGIQIVADIIDEQGSQDSNAIMTIDQNEAWYMEIYSGHQYAAVKCPDNMILTAGNEFVFDSLASMGIKKEDTILSKKLLDTAHLPDQKDFRVPKNCNNVMELDLFHTYAEPLVEYHIDDTLPLSDKEKENDRISADNSHRRTWCGHNLFASTQYPNYEGIKYPAFYSPDNNDKLDIHDVTKFMRNRFEGILDDETNRNYVHFNYDEGNKKLRYVGCESAYQVHAIQSDPNLPKEIAATMWLSLCNPNYTPFVPINAGVNSMANSYTRVSPTYAFDEQSAAHIFKKLNALAFTRRKEYGKPIEDLWNNYEKIWEQEYNEILNKTTKSSLNTKKDILTNYIKTTQNEAVKLAKFIIDDLTWHMMSDQSSSKSVFTTYKPCVNVKDYAHSYGYSYAKTGDTVSLKKGEDKYVIKLTNTEYRPDPTHSKEYRYVGEITFGDTTIETELGAANNEFYVPYETLSQYIKGNLVVNINEYKTHTNNMLVRIIPIAIGVPALIGATIYFVFKMRQKKKPTNNIN